MKKCIGFCSKKPCNCMDILEVHRKYREEKLHCAQNRERGVQCECITTCTKPSEYWLDQMEKHTFEKWYETNFQSELLYKQKLKNIELKVLKENKLDIYRWVTISLKKDETPKSVHSKISSLVKNKPFRTYAYCIEFYGKDDQYHPHIHMLYRKVGKLNADIKAIKNKFKIEPNFIDYKEINQERFSEKLRYIKGEKQEVKLDQVEKDTILLEKNDLKKYYICDELKSNVNIQDAETIQTESEEKEGSLQKKTQVDSTS